MSEVKGNTVGLKPLQKKSLQRLFQRHINKDEVISSELATTLAEISHDTGRQLGLIVDRRGTILDVYVGDSKGIMISELGRFRVGRSRFRGVRLLHTHLHGEPLTQDDLTDLALLRFDAILALEVTADGLPGNVHLAWLDPNTEAKEPWHLEPPTLLANLHLNFAELIAALEEEFAAKTISSASAGSARRKGILVGVTTGRMDDLRHSMLELRELADSAGIEIVDTVAQRKPQLNPRYVVGSGKLKDIMITALQKGADLIIFEGELSGSQMRAISELGEMEVIDRTQLILDIFARRAHSSDGKLQVELAQMKYSLPRLVLKDDCLSRITGGIGAKGPGETKLEVLRRRVQDRITKLEKQLDSISQQRRLRRSKRSMSGIPTLNLVGYTNAGKSTLLRTLTGADVLVEDRMFATLDPTSRRLFIPLSSLFDSTSVDADQQHVSPKLAPEVATEDTPEIATEDAPEVSPEVATENAPEVSPKFSPEVQARGGQEVIITDTVGFIQDLPDDLARAFKATLEEIADANILVHVVDASSHGYADQIMAVQEILEELALDSIPQILLFNKVDQMAPELLDEALHTWPNAVPISALHKDSLAPFLRAVARQLWLS